MKLRSWLIVPTHNAAKLSKVASLRCDAVIFDLSSADEQDKNKARETLVHFLTKKVGEKADALGFERWVRINPIGSPHWKEDLVAAMTVAPNGIVLPRATGSAQVQSLASEIYELEQGGPARHNSVRILPQVADSPEGALSIASFLDDPHPRIVGLSWDVGALAAVTHMGGIENDVVRAVRAQLLLTAKARGLMAIEAATGVVNDTDALESLVRRARFNGFDAMMARHPAQVPVIDRVFSPTDDDLTLAQIIVDMFEAMPEAQVLTVEGASVDRIALERAKRILAEH